MSFSIGNILIPGQLILAPMAGVTDAAFRTVCREMGAAYTVTEMVSAKALEHDSGKTEALLIPGQGERPFAAQIFGSDPDCMARAAQKALRISGADVIDINMGCPVGKIVKSGDGSALMRTPDLAAEIIEKVKDAVEKSKHERRERWKKNSKTREIVDEMFYPEVIADILKEQDNPGALNTKDESSNMDVAD